MRSCGVLVLLVCATASADDTTDLGLHVPLRYEHQAEPVLHLDPLPALATEGLGAKTDGATHVIVLGPRARLVGEGDWWMASSDRGAIDDRSRGWRAGYTLTYDLGPLSVAANASVGHVDSHYERGTYRTVSVSAYRTLRLSRWMLAWIALSAGEQTWLGEKPPPGESNGRSVMLTIGTTFR